MKREWVGRTGSKGETQALQATRAYVMLGVIIEDVLCNWCDWVPEREWQSGATAQAR